VPLPTFEYVEVLAAGWHVSHVLVPLVAPDATQAPPMAQKPAFSIGAEQTPLVVLQVPAVWHESGAVHVTWLPAVHTPDLHVSLKSHALPSLHVVPSVAAGFEHWPVAVLHVPATWHWSLGVHVTGLVPTHAPDSHAPPPKQRLARTKDRIMRSRTVTLEPTVAGMSVTAPHNPGLRIVPPMHSCA
jgi:hypothetical protein